MAAMETREASPSNLLVKIESFSLLGNRPIESTEFVAGDYKWRLKIYPNGDDNVKDRDHISVHLAVAEAESLPPNWEVNASFSIFLFNHISGNYLYSPGITRCFRVMKSKWGISKFISKKVLSDSSNGYLIDDNCVFGAEVLIVQRHSIIECLSVKNVNNNVCKRDFKISEFSKLKDSWRSQVFHAAGHNWEIHLYPKGNGEGTDHWVSIFLEYVGSQRVKSKFAIRMKSHVSDEHDFKLKAICWFSSSDEPKGWPSFIQIESVNDPTKGFLVKDCCLLNVEISVVAVSTIH